MEEHPTIRAWIAGVVTFAVVTAYFATPIMRFVDPVWLATLGFMLGVGAGCNWICERTGSGKWWLRGTMGLVIAASLGIILLVQGANVASMANDVRCFAIQKDMLSALPQRGDGPALFQALACRPQGSETVMFPQLKKQK